MPYYTRAGDAGETGTCDQSNISKSSLRIAAIGDVDELNSALGACRAACKDNEIDRSLERIQNELFTLGADLAMIHGPKAGITDEQTRRMEREIDELAREIGELKAFILPGGCELAAKLHMTRALCRRAERGIVELAEKEKMSSADLSYINRLSSLLFVLARLANKREGVRDVEWRR